MDKLKFENRKIVASNKYWNVCQSDFTDSKNRKWNIITLKSTKQWDWSFILALTRDNKIILNKDYKFWPDDFIYSFPSWFIEKWVSWKENILNELREETWFISDSEVIELWKTMQNWYIEWYNQLFFVRECYKKYEPETHEWEEIETFLVSIGEFEKMLNENKVLDPYSEITFYRAKKLI